jgi:hypothetical protein
LGLSVALLALLRCGMDLHRSVWNGLCRQCYLQASLGPYPSGCPVYSDIPYHWLSRNPLVPMGSILIRQLDLNTTGIEFSGLFNKNKDLLKQFYICWINGGSDLDQIFSREIF